MVEHPEELAKLSGGGSVMQLEIAVLTQIRDNISLMNKQLADHSEEIKSLTKSVLTFEAKSYSSEIERLNERIESVKTVAAAKADAVIFKAQCDAFHAMEIDYASFKGRILPLITIATSLTTGTVLAVITLAGNYLLRASGH